MQALERGVLEASRSVGDLRSLGLATFSTLTNSRERWLTASHLSQHICNNTNRTPAMAQCRNCDEFVTDAYVRVFAPAELDTVRVCPNCDDLIREGATVREAKATRR